MSNQKVVWENNSPTLKQMETVEVEKQISSDKRVEESFLDTEIRNEQRKPKVPGSIHSPAPSYYFNEEETQAKSNRGVASPPPSNVSSYSSGSDSTKHVYEYIYGVRSIEIKNKQYEEASMFVSKPIEVKKNVMQVTLEAVEEHPYFDELTGNAANRQTSIEYSISYVDSPNENDWHAILPNGENKIQSERLFFLSEKTASLRFPCLMNNNVKVYENGIILPSKEWSLLDNCTKVQLVKLPDPLSIYTISYEPNKEKRDPYTIDISRDKVTIKKKTDVFPDGASHNKVVKLSEYPFIDYKRVNLEDKYDANNSEYKPVQLLLKNATIAGRNKQVLKNIIPFVKDSSQEAFTLNKTDYVTNRSPLLRKYSLKEDDIYNGFEYYHVGNTMHLTETFNKADIYTNQEVAHGNAELHVSYEYIAATFRIRIVLRRNTFEHETVSPKLHEYRLKFKTMK